MYRVLLVEDEEIELETLRDYIDWKKNGISRVFTARNGRRALECLEENMADIVITDIQMPGMDGMETARILRQKNEKMVLIFVTAVEEYVFQAFDVAAFHYLVKPFSYAELLARIKALLRRKQVYTCGNMKENGQNVWIKKGDLKINTTGNKVFSGDEEIYLTETEYEILSLMLKYRGKIFSVQNIYESVWQEPFFNNSANTVMVHIRKLRLKIEKNPQKPQIIQTVWGKGYRIE